MVLSKIGIEPTQATYYLEWQYLISTYSSKYLLIPIGILFRPVSSEYILDYSGLLVDHYPLKGAQFLYGTGLAIIEILANHLS